MIRVMLADDHQILLDGLRRLIDTTGDMKVVATATDAASAIGLAREHRPDILVLDISMPGGGLEVARRVREMEIPTRIVILTMFAEDRYVMEAVRLGAAGYVLKRSADKELIEAIRAVAAGDAYLTPAAVRLLLATQNDEARPEQALSPREREVLRFTARGYSNLEIAERLFVSPKTVDTYRSRIMTKLDLHRRSQLVEYALAHGLLE